MKPFSGLASALLLLVPIAAAAPDPAGAQATHAELGEAALAAGRWADAEMSFRRAIGEEGDSPGTRIGLARAVAGGGDPDRAVADLIQAAERWIRDGVYPDAEAVLEVAAEMRPDDPAVLLALGRSRVLDRMYLAAEEPLARLHDIGGASVDGLFYYSATLWENGRLSRAEAVAREALEASAGAFPARYQLGRLLLWQSRFDEAAELLGQCAEQAPDAVDVRLDLARALAGAGRPEAALAVYREAVEMAPEHSELRYGLAMALLETGDRTAAQAELATYRRLYESEQRRTLDQGLAKARIARGRELLRQGRPEEAIAHLRGLPESADGLAAIAAALRTVGDLEGAVDELGRAIALEPGRTDLRALLNETRLELLRKK